MSRRARSELKATSSSSGSALKNMLIGSSARSSSGMFRLHVVALGVLVACAESGTTRTPDTTLAASPTAASRPVTNLVDSTRLPAAGDSASWKFRQTMNADLDGDGTTEQVVLTARVEMMRGRPVWDDGQPWQLYVVSPSGQRTHMYARFVQLGTLTMRLTQPDSGQTPRIVILEHLPDRLAIYEGEYRGPGQMKTVNAYERMVDARGDVASPSLP